jgi:hypothetical protein
MVDAVADAEVMLGTTNEDGGGWEKGGFGVSAADEKPSTTAAQSCNIVCVGLKREKCQGKLAQGFDWHYQWGFGFD